MIADLVALFGLFAAIAVPLAAIADWVEGRERRAARRRSRPPRYFQAGPSRRTR